MQSKETQKVLSCRKKEKLGRAEVEKASFSEKQVWHDGSSPRRGEIESRPRGADGRRERRAGKPSSGSERVRDGKPAELTFPRMKSLSLNYREQEGGEMVGEKGINSLGRAGGLRARGVGFLNQKAKGARRTESLRNGLSERIER